MNAKTISDPSELLRWEDIPKKGMSNLRKIKKVSDDFDSLSLKIGNIYLNEEYRSLKILKNIYDKNKTRIANNQELTPHKNLYSIICDKNMLRIAYRTLSKNKGAMTPGSVEITTTDINEKFLDELSIELKMGTFKWNPSKRIYIEKPGKAKKRPLGINDSKNKIVQEVIRMILEAIYEPSFEQYEVNSGFRPKRDCAYAIRRIKKDAQFAEIVIEGDIEGAYDNVNHEVLMGIIMKRIKDNKFLHLLYKGFKAGIIQDYVYFDTFLGVPQGGVCSPILFNIYMHELDVYMETEIKEFIDSQNVNKTTFRAENKDRATCRKKIKRYKDRVNILDQISEINQLDIQIIFETITSNISMFQTDGWSDIINSGKPIFNKRKNNKNVDKNPSTVEWKNLVNDNCNSSQKSIILNFLKNQLNDQIKILNAELKSYEYTNFYKTSIRLLYQRYADDFTVWIRGTPEFALLIKEKIKTFLNNKLKLNLSEEKTKITILRKEKACFLGFAIYRHRNHKIINKKPKSGISFNSKIASIIVDPDFNRLWDRLKNKGCYEFQKYYDNSKVLKPREITWLSAFELHQIIERFNQFLFGVGNYYVTEITSPYKLAKLHYIYYYSCLKTMCCKLNITIRELINKYGFFDISNYEKDYVIKNKSDKKNTYVTDKRICIKYEFDHKIKWMFLANYKEWMFKLLRYRYNHYLKMEKGQIPVTPQIDFTTIYKMNFRTRYKLISYCIICGAENEHLVNHHIKKLKHGGRKHYSGYKSFDKVIASLGRKQITICKCCHGKIHRGEYNSLKLSDLYDSRLAIPENYIRPYPYSDTYHATTFGKTVSPDPSSGYINTKTIFVDEINRTYFNYDFHFFLKNRERKKNKKTTKVENNS